MPILIIPELAPGDRVHGDFIVRERSEKTTRNGDVFVTLRLGNSSGAIDTAPIWSNNRTWADGAERGKVVEAMGEISTYGSNGLLKRQFTVSAPLRVLDNSQVDLLDFLPSVGDCSRYWASIDKLRAEISSAVLRRIVDLFFGDDAFRVRFERCPASVSGHHARLGGLLQHTLEVAGIARTTARASRANLDLVIAGALLHDIGKVEAYAVSSGGFEYTPCGHLLGHVVLGCLMFERQLALSDPRPCSGGQQMEIQHIILAHHGALEFGSPVRPMTLEAEIVHWADEASAKSNDMSESLEDADSFASEDEISAGKPWRVGRRLWRRPHGWE